MTTITTKDAEQTIELAKKLTNHLKPGMTLLLEGDLGTGKTTFTKGIGAGLKIDRIIKSPSYTIVREYKDGMMPLYHIDLYRLEETEVADLGLDEYFAGDGLSVVEWSSVAPSDLPLDHLKIELQVDPSLPKHRTITLTAAGTQYEEALDHFLRDKK